MSKMSELSQALDELVTCGEGLIRTANALRDLLSAEPEQGTGPQKTRAEPESEPEPQPEPVPEPEPQPQPQPDPPKAEPQAEPQPEFTFAEVRKAFTAKSRAGYTAEGTSAHELCAFLVEKALGRDVKDPTPNLDFYNAEMQSCAEGYASFVMEEVEKANAVCPDTQVYVEQRVDISRWVPGCGGTADCVILSDGELEVIDYKHSIGVPVSASSAEFGGTPQLMCYALGVLEMFDGIGNE